ncbi:hypothetical protein MYAM1_003635 [Malassezia yamatoensis]|uniref:Uncharacterized protein n=1 Tax=Malassezia yamatoensis TaxID=253288 RepID=A0AAJ5YV02_9BASI|nr:hypothetical protein MYAM1_003635 [Malassezia yamatoensis]
MVSGMLRSRMLASGRFVKGARSLHASRVVCAEEVPTSAAQSAQYPREGTLVLYAYPGFNSSLWMLSLLGVIGCYGFYNLTGTKKGQEEASALSQMIESMSTSTNDNTSNNQRHLDWAMKKAEAQLLIQDAQKPSAHRMINLTAFEQYPRRNMPVGSHVDVSDMQLNPERA